MQTSRRQFFGLLAAPVILKITKPMSLWIPVKPKMAEKLGNQLLTPEEFRKEALRLWQLSFSREFLDVHNTADIRTFADARPC